MNRSLLLICFLGCLTGSYAQFAGISVGAESLAVLANNLKEVSSVVARFNTNLNTARTTILDELNDLLGHMNITYTKMNETYGDSQYALYSLMSNMLYFNQTVLYAEQSLYYEVTSEFMGTVNVLKQAVNTFLERYQSLMSVGSYYGDKVDMCINRNASQIIAVPNMLKDLTQCIQTKAHTVEYTVPNAVWLLKNIKQDFTSLTDQLKTCSPSSTSCVNMYFFDLLEESSKIQMELYMVYNVVGWAFDNARINNYFCGILLDAAIQDAMVDLSNAVSSCMVQ